MALPFTFSSHFQFLSSGTNSYLCVGGGVGWGGVSSGVSGSGPGAGYQTQSLA